MGIENQIPNQEYEQEILRDKLTIKLRNPFWYILPAAMGVGTFIPATMSDEPVLYIGGGMCIGVAVALAVDYFHSYFRYKNYLVDNAKIDEDSRKRRRGLG